MDRIVYSPVDLGLAAGDEWPRGQNAPATMTPFQAFEECPRCGRLATHWLEPTRSAPPRVVRVTPEYVAEEASVQAFGHPAYIRVIPRFSSGVVDLDEPSRWRYDLSHADERAIEVWRRCRSSQCQHRWPEGSRPHV